MTPKQFFNLIEYGQFKVSRAYVAMTGDFLAGAFLSEMVSDAAERSDIGKEDDWFVIEPGGWQEYFCINARQFKEAIDKLIDTGFLKTKADVKLPKEALFHGSLDWELISNRLVNLVAHPTNNE